MIKGWVHRDVKPENILYNKSGEVRVIDYALARRIAGGFMQDVRGARFRGREPRPTCPPNRSAASRRTPSVDIYSFGITCYELACGRPPFRANSSQELLEKHLNERPLPLTTHNKLVTPEFNDLVLKMIQKRPADRYAASTSF